MSELNKSHLMGIAAFLLLLISWGVGLWVAPTEEHMGEVYRIIYLHVPSAFTAFFSAFALLAFSIWGLIKPEGKAIYWAKGCAESGLIFTVITLATGSIWGKPTWGVWWTWDARLTTTLLLALLYAGFLILYNSLTPGPQRTKICSALGVIIAADVPVIYKSVTWWRTLHQPPSIMREGESTMAPEMLQTLGFCLFASLLVLGWLLKQRVTNLEIEAEIDRQSREQFS